MYFSFVSVDIKCFMSA